MAHKEDARRVHMPHTEAFCSLLFFKALCYAHIGTWWVAISVAPIHLESLSKHHFASLGGFNNKKIVLKIMRDATLNCGA